MLRRGPLWCRNNRKRELDRLRPYGRRCVSSYGRSHLREMRRGRRRESPDAWIRSPCPVGGGLDGAGRFGPAARLLWRCFSWGEAMPSLVRAAVNPTSSPRCRPGIAEDRAICGGMTAFETPIFSLHCLRAIQRCRGMLSFENVVIGHNAPISTESKWDLMPRGSDISTPLNSGGCCRYGPATCNDARAQSKRTNDEFYQQFRQRLRPGPG